MVKKLLLLCIAFFYAGLINASINPDISANRVLILYSYDPSFPTSSKIYSGFLSAFDNNTPIIDQEYLDSKRLWDEESQFHALTTLQYKYRHRSPYDVIVTADDNALHFALENRDLLFPDADIVFLGVNDITFAKQASELDWVTGVVEAPSFASTINIAQDLFPQRHNIHILVDNTTSGQADLNSIKQAISRLSSHTFDQLDMSQLSWDELQQILASYSDNDIVLLLSAYRDKYMQEKSFRESISFVSDAVNTPIFHFWEHGLGEGVLGGLVISHNEQARQAGLIVKRRLNGEIIRNIPLLDKSPNLPMFDYQKLSRFAVATTALPYNSTVINQPRNIIKEYTFELALVALLILVLTMATLYLIRKNIVMRRLSRRLSEKSSYLTLLMNTLPDLVWIKNAAGVYLTCNKRFGNLFGAKEETIIGATDYSFVAKDQADAFRRHDLQAIANGDPLVVEEELTFASDGHSELLETIKTPIYDTSNGQLLGVLGVSRDITQRKRNELVIRENEQRYRLLFEHITQGVLVYNQLGEVIDANPAALSILSRDINEVIYRPFLPEKWFANSSLIGYDSKQNIIQNALRTNRTYRSILLQGSDEYSHNPVWLSIDVIPLISSTNQNHKIFVSFNDITEQKQVEDKIHHLAFHDSLTGLPNRRLLMLQLEQAIEQAKNNSRCLPLIYLDLDNFKIINDTLGHTQGDKALEVIADFLQLANTGATTIARVGGDEFVLLLDGCPDRDQVATTAQIILDKIDQPILLQGQKFEITGSIGICIYPQDGQQAQDLLRNADIAMYKAKHKGRNTYQFYDQAMADDLIARTLMENELRQAIERNELSLVYQPQYDFASHEIVGVEALLRWNNATLGHVPPDKMIPIAEECGLILSIGAWVLNEAARQAREWLDKGIHVGRIAVNIAGPQIRANDLVEQVQNALSGHQLQANHMALEVTETFIMQYGESSIAQLKVLDEMGVEISIDDFGTGYSSLSYLKRLPINKLKIDKSFIRDIPGDSDDVAISKTIIALGKSLGLKIIAEGVETQDQAVFLLSEGCNEAQGYLYSRPVSSDEIERLVLQQINKV